MVIKIKTSMFSLAMMVCLVLPVDGIFGAVANLDTGITRDRLGAFQNLANGKTQWPVWRVEKGSVVLDGRKNESAWEHAQPIYLTGEWMWNQYRSGYNWFYVGELKDFVSVWRLLYDSAFLYISCEYFDDVHSEGLYSESWSATDAVELTLFDPACYTGAAANTIVKTVSILRRFTRSAGLKGLVTSRGLSGAIDTIPHSTVEGDARLAGVSCKSDTIAHPCVRSCYPGAWFMEIKIPLCQVASRMSPMSGRFKVGLKIIDDDWPAAMHSYKYPVFGLGMERFAAWWTYDSTKLVNPFPTFKLMGYRTSSSLPDSFPDLANLYCGRTPDDYFKSTGLLYSAETCPCVNYAEEERPRPGFQTGPNLTACPNPFTSGTAISFATTGTLRPGLAIYNTAGEKVFSVDRMNSNRMTWDGLTPSGSPAPAGVYLIKLLSPGVSAVRSLTLVR